MHFELSHEQALIRETLSRFLADRYDLARRRQYLARAEGYSPEVWRELADLGLVGLAIPASLGGLGGSPVDMMVVMEEIGYHAAVEPFAPAFAIGAALDLADDVADARRLAGLVMAGDLVVSPALAESGGRFDDPPRTTSRAEDQAHRLTGAKRVVPYPAADLFLVSATPAPPDQPAGPELYALPAGTAGLTRTCYATFDGAPCCDLRLEDAAAPAGALLVGAAGGAGATERVMTTLALACAAESLGILRRLVETTRDYLKTRVQFGKPLATKQVIRHRIAEMYMHSELARSAVIGAVVREPGSAEWRRGVAVAKAMVGSAADFIGKQAVQLHGGMGVSDEHEVSHAFKRLMVLKPQYGDARAHARYLGAMAA